jgi:hypothetical protein
MYIELSNGFIKLGDSIIPDDVNNNDYRKYLEWLNAGNVPQVEIIEPIEDNPKWNEFRSLMLNDQDYQFMLISVMSPTYGGLGNWLGTTMQQIISMPDPSISLLKPLWNQIVSIHQPKAERVLKWQEYANQTKVPITFNSNGSI